MRDGTEGVAVGTDGSAGVAAAPAADAVTAETPAPAADAVTAETPAEVGVGDKEKDGIYYILLLSAVHSFCILRCFLLNTQLPSCPHHHTPALICAAFCLR